MENDETQCEAGNVGDKTKSDPYDTTDERRETTVKSSEATARIATRQITTVAEIID